MHYGKCVSGVLSVFTHVTSMRICWNKRKRWCKKRVQLPWDWFGTPTCGRHWLPVEQRITFKVLLLTFKALNNLAPPYLSQLIVPYNPTRNLRSASKHLLEVPSVRLKSYGDRAFSVAAPKHWNDIPLDIKLSGSVDVFKSRLKTYLFRLAFS